MRALVTGGAGFIGSHVVDRFLREGYDVRVIDSLEPRVHGAGVPSYLPPEAEFLQGSVTDRALWERALDGVDVVSHQAAYQDYMLDFARFLMVNSVSTALLYEVLVEKRLEPRKVIIASSQAVYGEGQYSCSEHGEFLASTRPTEQLRRHDWDVYCPACGRAAAPLQLKEEKTNPSNQYAVSKLSGEQIGLGLGRIHGIPTVALRYSITQGPRQSLFNQYSGILRIFSTRALAGKPLIIYEDGRQLRDFVHVDDVVAANFAVLESPQADYQSLNVGSGRPTTILEYADQMMRAVGRDVALEIPGQYRVGDNRNSVSDVARLRALDWAPRRGLETILGDFLAWIDSIGGVPAGITDAHQDMVTKGVVLSAG